MASTSDGLPVICAISPVNSPGWWTAMTWDVSPDSSTTSISPDLTTKKLQSQSPTLNSFSPALYFLSTVRGQLPSEAISASLSVGNATLCKSYFCMADPGLTAKLIFSLAQVRHGLRRHRQFHFIDVTPGPPFAWLEGCDHGVARVMEMSRGVAARRTIATADVTTAQAEPEMNPRRAQFQALFTPKSVRRNGINTGQVVTAHGRPPKVNLWLILPRYGRAIEGADDRV